MLYHRFDVALSHPRQNTGTMRRVSFPARLVVDG